MKKIFVLLFVFFSFLNISNAYFFDEESIERFISSPNFYELEYIQDLEEKYCEEAFLDAYRRRDFTEEENFVCSDFFARKIEDELNYKKSVLSERWIY